MYLKRGDAGHGVDEEERAPQHSPVETRARSRQRRDTNNTQHSRLSEDTRGKKLQPSKSLNIRICGSSERGEFGDYCKIHARILTPLP